MGLGDKEWGSLDWIDLTRDRDEWWAPLNKVMHIMVP
jgi:hypothetical protein